MTNSVNIRLALSRPAANKTKFPLIVDNGKILLKTDLASHLQPDAFSGISFATLSKITYPKTHHFEGLAWPFLCQKQHRRRIVIIEVQSLPNNVILAKHHLPREWWRLVPCLYVHETWCWHSVYELGAWSDSFRNQEINGSRTMNRIRRPPKAWPLLGFQKTAIKQ